MTMTALFSKLLSEFDIRYMEIVIDFFNTLSPTSLRAPMGQMTTNPSHECNHPGRQREEAEKNLSRHDCHHHT